MPFSFADKQQQQPGPRASGSSGLGNGRNGRNGRMDTPDSGRSPSSSRTSSPPDSRPFAKSPSLPRVDRLLKRSPKEKDENNLQQNATQKRSKGKLVKARDSSSSPQAPMSELLDTPRRVRPQRSSRSISVSSAISNDRESFIDLFSPSNHNFPPDLTDSPFVPASPAPSSRPQQQRTAKPPVPTTPKPDFARRSVTLPPQRPPPVGPPSVPVRAIPPDTMPPTTNFLNPTERAQLIKKSRKLAQVFGQTPAAAEFLPDARSSFLDVSAPGTLAASGGKARHGHRPAASMNMIGQMPAAQRPLPPWPAPENTSTIHMTVNGRRHSTPSTPVSDEGPAASLYSQQNDDDSDGHSFMDLSNSNEDADVGPDDSVSVVDVDAGAAPTPVGRGRPRPRPRGLPTSPSSPSLFETLSPEEQAEEERRKKRDKLAKLHRFLGSRVPTNLVLGPEYLETALPPPVVALDGTLAMAADPNTSIARGGPTWVKRRRSSSAAVLSSWSDDLDRLKEDLNDKEKAIIVRRAQKMEKVFGVAPPTKLYSAHHGSGSGSNSGTGTAPTSPTTQSPPGTFGRNPNQAPYRRKNRTSVRPGTADSQQQLLANAEPSAGAGSFVYTHYQHSLNSLHDILDRNDKESLAELHQYLNDTAADLDAEQQQPPASPLEFAPTMAAKPLTKAERRRSLPARTSMASLASISSLASSSSSTSIAASVATAAAAAPSSSSAATATTAAAAGSTASTPDADTSEFQQRRRRAAKLTQFFGVDYRDLIEDVLESIELGLDAERRRGTLNPAEAEDLLQKLRTLKTRR
ncbi:hypothetical protein C8R47DRAFT_1047815 [Mycena vitilis]|nr:hypothetical protein C8R47DRAFT_1047815 [Mycena vitilis]